ncbi:M16 family metallopeptidase [Mesoterricola sediminis]|uniref:Peptidase M16 n=1 Tax=Mesoterricola sediminis TaxID=2927980 RepID=A0AA48KDD6_9BACT|nr:pitrilysin family protein [Mesoterricola sediminis]BDU78184.1 peptidase M16 [Mesoterricola sediminis]
MGRTCQPARAVLAFLCALAPLAGQEVKVLERTLPNGFKVLLVERHDEPSIACGWVARAGSANERPGITGVAHLFEHMMFKGTRTIGTRDAVRDGELNRKQDEVMKTVRGEQALLRERLRRGEIQDLRDPAVRTPRLQAALAELDTLVKAQRELIVKDELMKLYGQAGGTGLNANTTMDRTFFHIDLPANKLELWAWLESDRLLNPVFREFYSERDVVLEERRLRVEATPTGKALETFQAMQWQASPYSWPVIGWPSDISSLTRDQADAFFSTYYAPGNITLILVGDFRADEAMATVTRYFGRIPGNPVPPPPVTVLEPPQGGEQRLVATVESMPFVLIAQKAVPAVHRDAAALDILSGILNGDSGRLKRALVQDRSVAVLAGSGFDGMKFGGVFRLYAAPVPGKAPEEMEGLLLEQVRAIQEQGVTDHELQKAKNQIAASMYRRMDSNADLRDQLAEAESAGTYRDFLEEPGLLQAVTREDVQRVARAYFALEGRNTLVVRRKEAK